MINHISQVTKAYTKRIRKDITNTIAQNKFPIRNTALTERVYQIRYLFGRFFYIYLWNKLIFDIECKSGNNIRIKARLADIITWELRQGYRIQQPRSEG